MENGAHFALSARIISRAPAFCEGGAFLETNSFLNTNSNLDFSAFQLPNVVNASDGQGIWERIGNERARVVFRKLLFDGARDNFGDLRVVGTVRIKRGTLTAKWQIQVVDTQDNLILDFGEGTSEGERIS